MPLSYMLVVLRAYLESLYHNVVLRNYLHFFPILLLGGELDKGKLLAKIVCVVE